MKAILEGTQTEYYRHQLRTNAGREIVDSDEVAVFELYEVMRPNDDGYLIYLEDRWPI